MPVPIKVAALRWPLEVGPKGKFAMCYDIYEAWDLRVRGLLSTRFDDRVMRIDYGCGVVDGVFSTVSEMAPEETIRRAMSKWLPRLVVEEVFISRTGGEVVITLRYRTPDGTLREVLQTYKSGAD